MLSKNLMIKKILEQQKINILKQAFNLTATSYGLQPIKLLIIKNKSIQRKLVDHSYHQQQIVQASHLLVICIDTNLKESDVEKYFERVKGNQKNHLMKLLAHLENI